MFQTVFSFKRGSPFTAAAMLIATVSAFGEVVHRPPSPILSGSSGPIITILPASGAGSLRHITANEASVDFGTVSYKSVNNGGKSPAGNQTINRSFTVFTRFAIRVDSNAVGSSHCTLRAFLRDHDPRYIIRIDGVRLSSNPEVIQTQTQFGVTTEHRM
jgi:hypothetical protein